jgi:uncharacterized membrane protein
MSVFEGGPEGRTPIVLSPATRAEESASLTHLVVVAFGNADEAQSALAEIKALVESGQAKLEDACVVVHEANGAIEITETMQKAGAFHVFRRDTGIERDFQQKLGAVLKPGCAALAVLGYGTDREAIAATVSKWKGEVVMTDLDDDAEAELRRALAHSEPPAS